MAFNRKQKLRDNIEAIRTAFILDRENRTATTEERAILQRYCGFGGLKCILNPAKELTDAVRWAKSDLELFAPTVELHRLIRENSKDETEYKRFVDSLKASVLTAFYTPKEITDTIADVLADYSVRPARMLEPSAGVGVFVDSMLRHSPNADVMAFEKDLLTGTILRHLYPDQKMRTCGFEKIERPFNNYFDLAVSNIPFGDIAVFDAEFQRSDSFGRRSAQKTIHNYFFLKGLEKWCRQEYEHTVEKSPIAKAIFYMYTRFEQLSGYVNDAQFCIDNNPVERSIRPLTLNRKNTLFSGSHEAAHAAAIFFSLMGCCRENKVNPKLWMQDVLIRVQENEREKKNDYADLLPFNWKG